MGEPLWYLLDANKTPYPVYDLEEVNFYRFYKTKRIRLTLLSDCFVSTVFLGFDHSFGHGPPILFETMIFGREGDRDMWRYYTWDEAMRGHRRVVRQLREAQRIRKHKRLMWKRKRR